MSTLAVRSPHVAARLGLGDLRGGPLPRELIIEMTTLAAGALEEACHADLQLERRRVHEKRAPRVLPRPVVEVRELEVELAVLP